MATITLATINDTLTNVEDNTEKTSRGITSFVDYLKDKQIDDNADKLEAKREATKSKVVAPPASGIKKSEDGGFANMFPSFLKGLSFGAIASALPLIGRRLLKNVFKGAPLIAFADFIVDNLLPDGLQNTKFRDQIAGGLKGLGFSLLLGGKFKLLFTALGALRGGQTEKEKEEFDKSITEFTENVKIFGRDLYKKLQPTIDDLIISFKELFTAIFGDVTMEDVKKGIVGVLEPIANAASSGMTALTNLIKGDFNSDNIIKSVGLLGSLAILLMPGKFMTLMARLALLTGGVAGGAIMALAKKGGGAALTGALSFFGMGGGKSGTAGTLATRGIPNAGGQGTLSKMFGLLKSGVKGAFGMMMSPTGAAILVPLAAVGITEALFGDNLRKEKEKTDNVNKNIKETGGEKNAVLMQGTELGLTGGVITSAVEPIRDESGKALSRTRLREGEGIKIKTSQLKDYFVNKSGVSNITIPKKDTGASMTETLKNIGPNSAFDPGVSSNNATYINNTVNSGGNGNVAVLAGSGSSYDARDAITLQPMGMPT